MKLSDIDNCKKLIGFLEENEIMSDNSPTSSCAAILYYYSEKNRCDRFFGKYCITKR